LALGNKQGIPGHRDRLGIHRAHQVEDILKCVWPLYFEGHHLDAERLGGMLHYWQGPRAPAWKPGRTRKHRHTKDMRKGFFEDLQLFRAEFWVEEDETGHIPTRAGKAGDESNTHRIKDRPKDDGDHPVHTLSRLLRRLCCRSCVGKDEIHVQADQFSRQFRGTRRMPLYDAMLDEDRSPPM
jgi:hypothetical protein